MKKFFLVVLVVLLAFLIAPSVYAVPLDLSTFTADGDVTASNDTVTMDESSGYWGSYFFDDFFSVADNALSLSFDYSLTSGDDDIDWLVMIVDYTSYELEITGTQSGSFNFDLTSFQGSTISLAFGLEPDTYDYDFCSIATFSNFDITYSDNQASDPVPEPATMILLGSGLVGLAGFSRKKHTT